MDEKGRRAMANMQFSLQQILHWAQETPTDLSQEKTWDEIRRELKETIDSLGLATAKTPEMNSAKIASQMANLIVNLQTVGDHVSATLIAGMLSAIWFCT